MVSSILTWRADSFPKIGWRTPQPITESNRTFRWERNIRSTEQSRFKLKFGDAIRFGKTAWISSRDLIGFVGVFLDESMPLDDEQSDLLFTPDQEELTNH